MKRVWIWIGLASLLMSTGAFWGCDGSGLVPRCVGQGDCPANQRCATGRCQPTTPPVRREPPVSRPDAGTPDQVPVDRSRPDVGKPDVGKPDAGPTDQVQPELPPKEDPPVERVTPCQPVLTSLSPSEATVGDPLSKLTLIGRGFKPTSEVFFETTPLKTTWIDSSTLRADIDVRGLAPGQFKISVSCGGATSQSLSFTLKPKPNQCPILKDTFKVPARDAEYLFVVDNSGSMADNLNVLQNNLTDFFAHLKVANINYQIGVTTMDTSGTNAPAGCLVGQTKIITPSTPDPLGTLQKNLTQGSSGSPIERGLEAAKQALSSRLSEPKCNQGFLRKDSHVVVIFVTDEKDQSPDTVANYVSFFQGLRSDPAKVKVGFLGGEVQTTSCTTDYKTLFPRYYEMYNKLGGWRTDFCALNTRDVMAFAEQGPRPETHFPLKQTPKAGTLKVTVDGKVIPNDPKTGYVYDAKSNVVVFYWNYPTPLSASTALPAPGATVVVEYQSDGNVRDDFIQYKHNKIDFLFVVDDSGSMADNQTALSGQMSIFAVRLRSLNIDFHVGVTTTDTTGNAFAAGCFQGTKKILTDSDAPSLLRQSILVGTRGSPQEQGLEAAYQALSQARLNDPKCNKGFLRNDAALAIVFLSDEDDVSTKTVQAYASFFKGLKASGGPAVTAHALVGPAPSGCSGTTGRAAHGSRYLSVSSSLGGVGQSICQLQGAMTAIINSSAGQRLRFKLSQQPDPTTIKVTADGNPVTGWTYDSATQEVVFTAASAPAAGARILFVYQTPGQCKP